MVKLKVKTINFKDTTENNFVLSPEHYLKGGDGNRDLSKCARCKKLVEDRHLYSRGENEKEFCFDCFHAIENISIVELLKKLKDIRDMSQQGIYLHGEIKKYSPSEKVKLLEACLKSIGDDIWELEKAVEILKVIK